MIPSRFCIHYVSKSGRPSSGHRTGKCQSSSQFPRRVVPKNVLTIGQFHSSPLLVGWRHQLDGHEFKLALGVGDGQGSLACCSPWGCKESNTTKRLNWTTVQLCSFHTLIRLCLKSFKLGFSSKWTEKFQMYKVGLEKAEEPETKLPTFVGS